MLTSDHVILSFQRGQAVPDRLTRVTHRHYLDYARRMLEVYRQGIGQTRRELHRAVANVLANEPDCPRQRIAAFCKLLDDAGEFDTDRKGCAAELRLKVFAAAAACHPLVIEPDQIFERSETEVKSRLAAELGQPWEKIDASLYVDVIDRQPLLAFEGFDSPEALLSRYNLAQLQASLYKARRMSVEATADFAAIIRYAKLNRLLVETRKLDADTFRIDLSGPASVLQETRRYGVNFARFVGALAACKGWKMRAEILTPWKTAAQLRVSSEDGYRSHVPSPAEFDSEVESTFAAAWGESRNGWTLIREAGILQHRQLTFVPDFLLRHTDGREVFLEIVGFWTPEYLASKRATIAQFRDRQILLAVSHRTAKAGSEGAGVVVYKTKLKPEAVLQALASDFPAS